jgi:hypothetical protein
MTSTTDTIGFEIVDGPDYSTDADGWEHHAYTLKLTYDGREMMSPWRAGLGITDDPTLADVLESLFLDTDSYTDDFEEWASEYGYDTDSRKAEATWRAVGEQAAKVRALFGDDYDAVREQYQQD